MSDFYSILGYGIKMEKVIKIYLVDFVKCLTLHFGRREHVVKNLETVP